MSAAQSLLAELNAAGVAVSLAPNGGLACRPASALTDAMRVAIRQHKAELVALLDRSDWNEALADAWIAVTLERVGQLHDQIAPDCPIGDAEWDRAEALVAATCTLRSRQALRDALDQYEAHARQVFTTWCTRQREVA